jgi:hypothetical protein
MFEYRANRKLSLQLRDLVEEGKVEEATRLAEEQVGSCCKQQIVQCAIVDFLGCMSVMRAGLRLALHTVSSLCFKAFAQLVLF